MALNRDGDETGGRRQKQRPRCGRDLPIAGLVSPLPLLSPPGSLGTQPPGAGSSPHATSASEGRPSLHVSWSQPTFHTAFPHEGTRSDVTAEKPGRRRMHPGTQVSVGRLGRGAPAPEEAVRSLQRVGRISAQRARPDRNLETHQPRTEGHLPKAPSRSGCGSASRGRR